MICVIDTPTVTGEVGSLLTLLGRILCVGEVVREVSGPTFTDHSAEARTEAGTPFNLLAATTDRVYVGYDDTFDAVRFKRGTAGAGVTVVVEYWNGSAWTAVAGLSDGTTGLSVDGQITWTRPTRAQWAKNQVNSGPSMYHVRITTSGNPSVTPTAEFLVVNWTVYDDAVGTNDKVYKTIGEDGALAVYLRVRDNSQRLNNAGAATARAAAVFVYETWDAGPQTGTGQMPASGQFSNDGFGVAKSASANSTVRNVRALVSRDVLMLFIDQSTTGAYIGTYFGRISSYLAGDAFPIGYVGCGEEVAQEMQRFSRDVAALTQLGGKFVQRAYTGSGGSTGAGWTGSGVMAAQANLLPYPNGPNGGLVHRAPIWYENGRHLRGEGLSGVMIPHASGSSIQTDDTFTRASDNKKFRIIKLDASQLSDQLFAFFAIEDHD